jgi:hypothetical protein
MSDSEKPNEKSFSQADLDKASAQAAAKVEAIQLEKEALLAEKEQLAKERDELKKEKMSEHEKAVLDAKEEAKNSVKPQLDRLEKMEKKFEKLLELELQDVPDEFKGLIPETGSAEDKLDWLKKAKEAKLFGSGKGTSTTSISTTQAPGSAESSSPEHVRPRTPADRKKVIEEINNEFGTRLRI